MLKRIVPILALAPIFAIGAGAAWRYHLPAAAILIALGYLGFLFAYARPPRAH